MPEPNDIEGRLTSLEHGQKGHAEQLAKIDRDIARFDGVIGEIKQRIVELPTRRDIDELRSNIARNREQIITAITVAAGASGGFVGRSWRHALARLTWFGGFVLICLGAIAAIVGIALGR